MAGVMDTGRLREMMKLRRMSQTKLARLSGTTQGTIYKLLIGDIGHSKYARRIARNLKTSVAYLERETDDPSPDAVGAALDEDAQQLLDCFEDLTLEQRGALLQLARSMAGWN